MSAKHHSLNPTTALWARSPYSHLTAKEFEWHSWDSNPDLFDSKIWFLALLYIPVIVSSPGSQRECQRKSVMTLGSRVHPGRCPCAVCSCGW